MSTKRRREKKETLSIDRSKLWNGGLGVYPVAIGVTIVPLQAALALTRRMLKFCTGTLPHKWAVIVSEGDMSFWAWSVISKISQVEIAKSSEPQVRIFYVVNKTTQNNHYINRCYFWNWCIRCTKQITEIIHLWWGETNYYPEVPQ